MPARRAGTCTISQTRRSLRTRREIAEFIRCTPETPRHCTLPKPSSPTSASKVEKHITNTYLKAMTRPLGVDPCLRAWMELSVTSRRTPDIHRLQSIRTFSELVEYLRDDLDWPITKTPPKIRLLRV